MPKGSRGAPSAKRIISMWMPSLSLQKTTQGVSKQQARAADRKGQRCRAGDLQVGSLGKHSGAGGGMHMAASPADTPIGHHERPEQQPHRHNLADKGA